MAKNKIKNTNNEKQDWYGNISNENWRIKSSPIKTLIFILILVFYGSLLVHKINLPAADDLPRHIMNGEMIMHGHFEVLYSNVYSYTEPGQTFVNHHWLSGVFFYLLYQVVGWGGLVIFKALVLLVAFASLFFASIKKAPFWLVALFSIPTIFILAERTDLRPEIFSYLFIAVYLYLLTDLEENPLRKRIYWLIPLQLLWVNLHIFFPIGIMLVGGFLLEKIFIYRKKLKESPLIKKLIILLIVLTAISIINPNGIHGALAPMQILSNYGAQVTENQSLNSFLKTIPSWEDISASIFKPAISLLALSFLFGFKRKPIFYFLAATGTAIVGFLMVRTLPLFGIIFLPTISSNFSNLFYKTRDWLRKKIPDRIVTLKNFLVLLFVVTLFPLSLLGSYGKLSIYNKPGIGITPRSLEAANFFVEHNLKGPILNDFGSGSYLIFNLFPREKVFVDNRPEAYPTSFFSNVYFPVTENKNAWPTISKKYNFNAIFIYQYAKAPGIRTFLYERVRDPAWSLVYAGTYHFILLKNTPENQSVIEQFRITSENIGEKLAYLADSPSYDDQVAAADIFNLVGREDLGSAMFLKVVSGWPERGKVWMMMGEWKLMSNMNLKNPSLAVTYLEKAISLGQDTAEAYYYLAIGYKETGQAEKAKEAVAHVLNINPENQAAKNLLSQL